MLTKRIVRAAAVTVAAMLGCASAQAQEWEHAVTPYLWGSGMSGNTTIGTPLGPLDANVDLNFSEILKNLDFGAMVSYQGGRGKWVVLGDLIFMNLGGDKTSTKGPLTTHASADIEQSALEADVGYHITESISLFVGARYNDIDAQIGVDTTGPGPGSSRSAGTSESWIDPVIGLLGEWPLNEHWQWDLRGDIGGFGVGSEFAWQVQGMLRWKVKTNLDVVASYRYMQMDYEQDGNSGLLNYNMVMSGPGLGVTFHF